MTDRELLEMAAKAAGILFNGFDSFYEDYSAFDAELDVDYQWNPIDSDGDVFRLALNLGLSILIARRESTVYCCISQNNVVMSADTFASVDLNASIRRAIVLAAAEIAKAMP